MDTMEDMHNTFGSMRSISSAGSGASNSSKVSKYWSDLDKESAGGKDYLYTENGISPRKGGPKEVRLNKVKLMKTGRYIEAAIARGECSFHLCVLFPDLVVLI